MHGEDMWRARRHLDANHCSDAAVGQKNPRCCPPQRRNIPSLHYEQTTVVSGGACSHKEWMDASQDGGVRKDEMQEG